MFEDLLSYFRRIARMECSCYTPAKPWGQRKKHVLRHMSCNYRLVKPSTMLRCVCRQAQCASRRSETEIGSRARCAVLGRVDSDVPRLRSQIARLARGCGLPVDRGVHECPERIADAFDRIRSLPRPREFRGKRSKAMPAHTFTSGVRWHLARVGQSTETWITIYHISRFRSLPTILPCQDSSFQPSKINQCFVRNPTAIKTTLEFEDSSVQLKTMSVKKIAWNKPPTYTRNDLMTSVSPDRATAECRPEHMFACLHKCNTCVQMRVHVQHIS